MTTVSSTGAAEPRVNGIPLSKLPAGMVPDGMVFPTGIDGAVSAGRGLVRVDDAARSASIHRAVLALGHANVAGLPLPGPSGDLPSGIHAATQGEFLTRFGTTPRRQQMLVELRTALATLREEGVEAVVIGGSFVGAKPGPGDVDLAWVRNPRTDPDAVERAIRRLKQQAPSVSVHAADRVVDNAPMLKAGVPGENFIEMFQHDKAGAKRGAVLLSTADEALGALDEPTLRRQLADHAMRGLRALSTVR